MHEEEDLSIHQARLAKRDDPVAVGVMTDVVGGLQFDQWYAATGLAVHDLNRKVRAGRVGVGCRLQGAACEDKDQSGGYRMVSCRGFCGPLHCSHSWAVG